MESKFGPRWSRSEDDRLSELISVYGDYAWDDISRNMSNAALVRTPIMCSTRWRLVLRKGIAMGPWSPQEDSMIMACVEKGYLKWSEIAKCLPRNRLGKQCRERWSNHLDPQLKRCPWSEEENELLCELQQQHGNKWSCISLQIVGRSENEIKNRWNSAQMRKWFEAKYPPADVAIHGRVMKDHSRKRSDYARVDPFQPCSDYKFLKSEWHEAAGRRREGVLMQEEGMGVEHLCEDDLLSIQAADEYLSRRYEYTPSERLAQVEGDYENENEGSELK